LVGGSAGPLGGDELRCSVDLGPGARLEVRSVAASVALPGPNGRESSLEILARIGEGAALSWSPQPLIAARGARHRTIARVELAADARLVWRDELVLGRDGEEPGSVSTRLRVVRDGKVLLDHEIAMGPRHPGSLGPASSGGHRALGIVLIVEPAWESEQQMPVPRVLPQDDPGVAVAVMRLSGPAVLVSAAAKDEAALSRILDSALG
jgi:urease accessory protein